MLVAVKKKKKNLLWQLEHGFHGLEPLVAASFPTEEFGEHLSSEQNTQ